ncbi:MAG: hypothetical protein V2A79_03775 [Planctomycetota bacterium]
MQGHNDFGRIARGLEDVAHDIVVAACSNIAERSVSSMAGGKSGRMYGQHQASAPGEAPAIDTGQLADSIQTEVSGSKGMVYTNSEHGPHMEWGTHDISPRPFFAPAAEAERKPAADALVAAIRRLS